MGKNHGHDNIDPSSRKIRLPTIHIHKTSQNQKTFEVLSPDKQEILGREQQKSEKNTPISLATRAFTNCRVFLPPGELWGFLSANETIARWRWKGKGKEVRPEQRDRIGTFFCSERKDLLINGTIFFWTLTNQNGTLKSLNYIHQYPPISTNHVRMPAILTALVCAVKLYSFGGSFLPVWRRMLPSSSHRGLTESLHFMGHWLAGDAMEDVTCHGKMRNRIG